MVAEIGEDRMLQPGATGDWSFKDVVAHLNGWRIGTLARLAAARDHSDPAAPPWPADLDEDDEGDVDKINDWIYRANRERPLGEVLGEYRHSFQRMYDATSALSENELNDIDRYPWLAGHRLANVITASFGHFHEEHEPLKTLLEPDGRYAPGKKPSHWFRPDKTLLDDASAKAGDIVQVSLEPTKEWIEPLKAARSGTTARVSGR